MTTYVDKRSQQLGLKKVDATRDLHLEVLDSDIKKASRSNSSDCAFACATRRLPKVRAAYFFRSCAWIEYPQKLVRYLLPSAIQKEIVSFDRGANAYPGLYRLLAPRKSQTLAGVRKRNHRLDRSKPKKRSTGRKLHRVAAVRTMHAPAYIASRAND